MHGDVSKILLKPGAPEPKVLLPHDVMGGTPGADARACQATHFVKPLTALACRCSACASGSARSRSTTRVTSRSSPR